MKTTTPRLNVLAASAAFLFLAGCERETALTSEGQADNSVLVEGRVSGDAALRKSAAGSDVEGAVISVIRIGADGSKRTVSGEAKADAEGRFSIRIEADGERGHIVCAKKEGKEWKAVVSARAGKGKKLACRPLDSESSLEAEVFELSRAGAAAESVSFADIAAKIDAEIAAWAGTRKEAKAQIEAFLSAQAKAEARVRAEAFAKGIAKPTRAQLEKAEEARLEAVAKLEAALASGAVAEARAALEAEFSKAEHQAWLEAGLELETVVAARESCFRALLDAGAKASLDSGAKALWLRKLALEHASHVGIAVDAEVRKIGGGLHDSGSIAAAAAALEASIKAAVNGAAIDSAFDRFHLECDSLKLRLRGAAPGDSGKGPGFVLNGTVEGDAAGAEAHLARIKGDGSLEIVGGAKASVDAQGGFSIVSDSAVSGSLVVVVTHDEDTLKVSVEGSSTAPVKVDVESTGEVEVLQRIAQEGLSGVVSPEAVKAHVDSCLAAGVLANDSAANHVLKVLAGAAPAPRK